jgi:predicted nucleic acid-binding protein
VKLVLDAGFAMLWLGGERDSAAVAQFEARYHSGFIEMHAPELFVAESANVLWNSVRRGTRTLDDSVTMFRNLTDLKIELHRHRDLAGPALDLAMRRGISAYDAFYVALAMREALPLFTADHKLAAATGDLIEVVTD